MVFTTALPDATRALRVRALRHSSGGRGLTGEQRSVKTVTQSVRWPAPLRASALKEQNFSKRVHG